MKIRKPEENLNYEEHNLIKYKNQNGNWAFPILNTTKFAKKV